MFASLRFACSSSSPHCSPPLPPSLPHAYAHHQAFQALGGNSDKTGSVATTKLKGICDDFELSIDIDELVALYDDDNSGFIDYEEFAAMLKDDAVDAAK